MASNLENTVGFARENVWIPFYHEYEYAFNLLCTD